MAKTKALTTKRIAKLLKQPGRWKHHDGHGLFLVGQDGRASWFLRYQTNYRERWHGLGPLHTVTLKEARERARKARLMLLDGQDPIDTRRAEKAARALEAAKRQEAMTFTAATKGYLAKQSPEWRNSKTAPMFISRMKRFAFPVLGNVPVEQVDKMLVLKTLKPLWETKPASASRLRHGIERVLTWAIAHDLRAGPNPAAWVGNLDQLLPNPGKMRPSEPHAAMDYHEVPGFMRELRERRQGIVARALEFTILTAARTSETLLATWDEIDLDAKLWSIPASRMKSHRPHEVPLSDAAVALLRALPREKGNDFVFIGTRDNAASHLAKNGMALLLQRMKRHGVTTHGFRSAFRTWCAERTNFPDHIAELALAHAVDSGTVKAYKRTTLLARRRKLLDLWSAYCASVPAEGQVVPIRKAV
jgi:integrase